MSLPLFLRGLVGVLIVFAVVTYLITGSAWTAFIDTVICAILLQIGYFAAVLYLVWRAPHTQQPERGIAKGEAAQAVPKEGKPATNIARLPTTPSTPSSPHP